MPRLTPLMVCAVLLAGPLFVSRSARAGGGAAGDDTPPAVTIGPTGEVVSTAVVPTTSSAGSSTTGGSGATAPVCGWTKVTAPPPQYSSTTTTTADGRTADLYYTSSCDPNGLADTLVFVPRVTPWDLIPGAEQTVRSQIPAPATEFMDLEPRFGWTFVTKPTDFRVQNMAAISATASVTAGPQTVAVTVTATPVKVTFYPGEPRGVIMACTAAGAVAPFVLRQPGLCSYTYRDSSAISGNGRTFTTTTAVEWSIGWSSASTNTGGSSKGNGALPVYSSRSDKELAVAEVQAVVTCTGPRPEQGGC